MNTVPRVARELGMTQASLRGLLAKGRLEGVKVPAKNIRHLLTCDEIAIIRRYVGSHGNPNTISTGL